MEVFVEVVISSLHLFEAVAAVFVDPKISVAVAVAIVDIIAVVFEEQQSVVVAAAVAVLVAAVAVLAAAVADTIVAVEPLVEAKIVAVVFAAGFVVVVAIHIIF